MARDISMAYVFGTQGTIAALLIAFRFSHLLRRLLGEGAMQSALIPYFEELRKESPERAGRFFCDLTLSLSYTLIIFILLMLLILGGLLKWGILSEGNQEIVWLTFLMMPSLLFICLFGINASLMQCEKKYFSAGFAPVIFNVFWIIGTLYCSQLSSSRAMSVLSIFIIIACLAQWAVTLPTVYKILKNLRVNNFWKKSKSFSIEVIQLAKPLGLGILGVGAAQINNALDAIFARWADPEGPAILWYAIRIQQLPLALFGVAIGSALLPPLSRAIKARDMNRFYHFLDFSVGRTLFLMIPITFGIFLFGETSISLIYGRGDFHVHSAIETTKSLWGYGIGLLPMSLILIFAPAFYAQNDYRTPSQAAIGSMILNGLLNGFMIHVLGFGSAGIALATSLSAWTNLFWLGIKLKKQLHWDIQATLKASESIVLAALIASGSIILIIQKFWKTRFPWQLIQKELIQNNGEKIFEPFIQNLIQLCANGSLFLIIFLGAFLLFRSKTHLSQKV